MAKNTFSSAFRKIDVDQYNEDNYREEEQAELQSAPVGPDEAEITTLMNQYPYNK
jgi:actin related protein 2/3 complex subunit 5